MFYHQIILTQRKYYFGVLHNQLQLGTRAIQSWFRECLNGWDVCSAWEIKSERKKWNEIKAGIFGNR